MMKSRTHPPQDLEAPPAYSLFKVASTIKEKGLVRALDDMEQGPHVHLTLLLITVLIVSGLIILFTSILG